MPSCPTSPEFVPTFTALAMNDEFAAVPRVLDPKWTTTTDGAAFSLSTVDLIARPSPDNIYDLTTREDVLLIQSREAEIVGLRQGAIPGDGEQIIVAFAIVSPGGSNQSNGARFGIGFNDDNTIYNAGTRINLMWDGTEEGGNGDGRMMALTNGAITGLVETASSTGRMTYLRVIVDGTTARFFWSGDMRGWSPLGEYLNFNLLDNFWIFVNYANFSGSGAELEGIIPFYWVRHLAYTGDLDPWPLVPA